MNALKVISRTFDNLKKNKVIFRPLSVLCCLMSVTRRNRPEASSAKQPPVNVHQLINSIGVIFSCSVGERSRKLALLNAALEAEKGLDGSWTEPSDLLLGKRKPICDYVTLNVENLHVCSNVLTELITMNKIRESFCTSVVIGKLNKLNKCIRYIYWVSECFLRPGLV